MMPFATILALIAFAAIWKGAGGLTAIGVVWLLWAYTIVLKREIRNDKDKD